MLRPGDILPILDISSETIGTQPMTELDIEITPILTELVTLSLENNENPTVRKLFNWLAAPERTGEEFYYVTGPLQRYVLTVMMDNSVGYMDRDDEAIPGKYLAKVAAEALAVHCPVLEGSWEHAAWVLVKESSSYIPDDNDFASYRLTAWVVSVIGDPILCPNPYLRIELMSLLYSKVELNDHRSLQTQAVESVLFACSSLNINYLLESRPQYGTYHQMEMDTIIETLEIITENMDREFDETLSEKLMNVRKLRLSVLVKDVAYCYAVNSNQFEEPKPLYGLTAILKTINGYIQLNYKDYKEKNSNLFSNTTGIIFTTNWLSVFIQIFKKSCWTPHLFGLTASSILTTMEIVMSEYVVNEVNERRHRSASLYNIGMMLIYLFDENLFIPEVESPENMTVMLKYKERLTHLKINYC